MTTPGQTLKQIEPQPARGKFHEGLWVDPKYVAQEKYDGDRRLAHFVGPLVRFTGRRQSVNGGGFVEKSANLPHLSGVFEGLLAQTTVKPDPDLWRNRNVPSLDGTILDGEVLFVGQTDGGGKSKYVTSIMGSTPTEAIRKQAERGWLVYVVFDCLFYMGQDVRSCPYHVRRKYAQTAVNAWRNPYAYVAPEVPAGRSKALCDEVLARDGEGVVLKHVDSKYGEKTRWVKVKGTWTADVVIVGFQSAKELSVKKGADEATVTKYAAQGLIGAVVCGQVTGRAPHGEFQYRMVATVSGMDDALRENITKHPDAYLGKVLRIKHNGREPTGRFRHPRWDDLRDDKGPEACTYDPDET